MNSQQRLEQIQYAAGDTLRLVNQFVLARDPRRRRLLLERLKKSYADYREVLDTHTREAGAMEDADIKVAMEYDAKTSTAVDSITNKVA
jgi:hypothetical protein